MGINSTYLSEFLGTQPLSELVSAGQPVFATSGPDKAAVWANPAAFALFGVSDLAQLSEKLRTSTDPAIRHLARLGSRLRPGGAAQLQKIRFRNAGNAGLLLTMRCWAVNAPAASSTDGQAGGAGKPQQGDQDIVFWAAALDAPRQVRGNATQNIQPASSDADPVFDAGASASLEDVAAAIAPETNIAASAEDTALKEPPTPRRANVRFMWRSDGDGKLLVIDDALCEALGCANDDLAGKTFEELIDTLPLEPAAPLRLALAKRDTWSRVEILWPVSGSGSGKCAPVTLGGLPSFDRSGRFDGYSGFGVIHLGELVNRPPRAVPDGVVSDSGSGDLKDKSSAAEGDQPSVGPNGQEDDKSQSNDAETPAENDTTTEAGHAAGTGTGGTSATGTNATGISNVVSLRAWQSGSKSTQEEAEKDQADAADTQSVSTDGNAIGYESDDSQPSPEAKKSSDAATPLNLNVPKADPDGSIELSDNERDAFREIARTLGARSRENKDQDQPAEKSPAKESLAKESPAAQSPATESKEPSDKSLPGKIAEPQTADGKGNDETAAQQQDQGPDEKTDNAAGKEQSAVASQSYVPTATSLAGIAKAIATTAALAKSARAKSQDTQEATDETVATADESAVDQASTLLDEKAKTVDDSAKGISDDGSAEKPAAADTRVGIAHAQMSELIAEVRRTQDKLSDKKPRSRMSAKAEHKRKRRKRDRDKQTAALLDRIGDGLIAIQGGAVVYANHPMMTMLNYSSFEQFLALDGLTRIFRGRDPETLAREAAGGAIPVVTRNGDVLAMDGKVLNASWNGKPATLLALQPSQMLEREAKLRGLELDIRKRETEIRELHSIMDTATDGVAVLDEEGRILSLNGSGQALFGYDQNEVVGEKLTILLARDSRGVASDYFNGLKSNGVRNVLNDGREVIGRASKGGSIPLFMTIGCINSGPNQRFCAVLRDVTQWKKAERELSDSRQEAERTSSLKSEFLAKISHEVRTPMNAILGFAEVIIDERFGPVENERYKDYLKDIHASGTHVLSLINDLLDLSKIEAGKMELDFGAVDVTKVVNECVSIMQSQAINERVIMRLSLASHLPKIVADERSLRQIVLNLISNAVKFNEAGGQIIISTALTDSGSAVVRIRDTGIGMSDKEIEMALEPFRQIATSHQSGGTGLGLPLTKALVEANRASFSIKSKKGEGTLVEVAFPQTRVLAE